MQGTGDQSMMNREQRERGERERERSERERDGGIE